MTRAATLAAAALAALAAPAAAADAPACGSFDLYPVADGITPVDEPPEGPSPGDRRIARYLLTDEDGATVGRFDVVATVLAAPEGGETELLATGVHAFASGTVTITMRYTLPDPASAGSGPDRELVQAVTGGTGDFAGASGTTTSVTLDDGRRRMTFDLDCS